MSAYGHLDPLALHLEVATVERLLLALDPDYFGAPKTITIKDPRSERQHEKEKEKNREEDLAREQEMREAAEEEAVKAVRRRKRERREYMRLGEEERLWWSYRQVQGHRERAVREQEKEYERRLSKRPKKRLRMAKVSQSLKTVKEGSVKDKEQESEEMEGQIEDSSEETAAVGDEADEEGGEEGGDAVEKPELRPWEWRCGRCQPCCSEDCGTYCLHSIVRIQPSPS